MKDPFVAEVRKHRSEHAKKFDNDLHRICEDLRRLEATLGDRVVRIETRTKSPARDPKHQP